MCVCVCVPLGCMCTTGVCVCVPLQSVHWHALEYNWRVANKLIELISCHMLSCNLKLGRKVQVGVYRIVYVSGLLTSDHVPTTAA